MASALPRLKQTLAPRPPPPAPQAVDTAARVVAAPSALLELDEKTVEDICSFCDQESVRNLRLTCRALARAANHAFGPASSRNGIFRFAFTRAGLSELLRLTDYPDAGQRIKEIKLGACRLPGDLYIWKPHFLPPEERRGRKRYMALEVDGNKGTTPIEPWYKEYAFCLAKDDQLRIEQNGDAVIMLARALKKLRAQGVREMNFHSWYNKLGEGRGSKQDDELIAMGCTLDDDNIERVGTRWVIEEACKMSGIECYRCWSTCFGGVCTLPDGVCSRFGSAS